MAFSTRATRSLTGKAEDNYELRKIDFKKQLRRAEQEVLLLTRHEGPSDYQSIERDISLKTETYCKLSEEFCIYLNMVKTEDSELERQEQCTIKDRLLEKVNVFISHMRHKVDRETLTEKKQKTVTVSSRSSHHSSSSHRSRVSDKLILTQAKVQAAKAKLIYAEQEMSLRKQRAALIEEESNILAATARKKIDLETELQLLQEKKEFEAIQAEAEALEMSFNGSRTNRNIDLIPEIDPHVSTADFVNNHCVTTESVKGNTVVSEVQPTPAPEDVVVHNLASDFTRFLLKKDLLISRLHVFDDRPENYLSWKTSFKNIMKELNVSEIEELDLLIKYLGPQSRKQATTLKSAYGTMSGKALDKIWHRMEERYGAPELIEEAVKRKLASFPSISARDNQQLYELADIVSEIECIKENPIHQALFAFYDSSAGISPIVIKLPHFLQEKWISQASQYKKRNNVPHPPFSFFANFVREMAKVRNDPSFHFPSTSSTTPSGKKFPERNQRYANQTVSARKTDVLPQSSDTKVFSSANQCPIHRKNHSLSVCNTFKSRSNEDKRKFLKENNLCYKCLNPKHQAKDCKSSIHCEECGSSTHVTAMHFTNFRGTEGMHGGEKREIMPNVNTRCTQINDRDHGKSCAKFVLVDLYCSDNPENIIRCYAMLDDQSNRSLVKPEVFSLLGIDGTECQYTINSCSGTSSTSGRRAENCIVRSVDRSVQYSLPGLIECHDIPYNKDEICTPENASCFPHLREVAQLLPDIDHDAKIMLLLGRDVIESHKVLDQVVGPPEAPFAQRLGLGWVVIGELCLGNVHSQETVNVHKTQILENGRTSLFKQCSNKFVVTDLGFDPVFERKPDDDKPSLSIEDRRFLEIMDSQIHKDENGFWVAPLPFRSPRQRLVNNREQALKRARLLDINLQKNPVKRQHMVEFMEKVFDKGHAELAPDIKLDEECWYLPFFGVYHPKKPDQIRGVFDSSAEFKGMSLNSVLLSGPDLSNSLLGILLRFRRDLVAVTADVEQMFYCFSVEESHRNYLRFLWYQDNDPCKPLVEYRMCKHVFGNSPSPAIATYGLRKTVEDCDIDVKEFVGNDFYVDDGLASKPSTSEAVDLLKRTQEALKRGGLHLHKIASNDADVMRCFPQGELVKNLISMDLEKDCLPTQRSLGLGWDLNDDTFVFNVELLNKPLTKRGMLSTINSIFDPIGFLSPVVVEGRLILREVVSNGCAWDDPLPLDIESRWIKWKKCLENLKDIQIPRAYFGRSFTQMQKLELHVFSDASEKAISAVVYIVGYTDDLKKHVGFVIGKTKVAPASGHTIPRLELCGAVLAVELYGLVVDSLNAQLSQVKFYTDSRIVLGYIHNQSRRFFTYVSNRVQKIRQFSRPDQWNYVPSELNPADVGSRGIDPSLLNDSSWLYGPKFLSDQVESVPEFFPLLEPDKDKDIRCNVLVTKVDVDSVKLLGSREFEKFSSWDGLVSALSTLRHVAVSFAKKLPCKGWHLCSQSREASFRNDTEILVLKNVQSNVYQKEIVSLRDSGQVHRDSSILVLDPFLDENGLLRVGGRLSRSSLTFNQKHPVVLPGNHHIAKLIARHHHHLVRHQGRQFTEGAIRVAGYWITGGKRLISSLIFNCVTCRKLRGKFACQKMSELPVDRVEQSAPFTYVGVDVFGPWYVVTRKTRGGQASSKRWCVMFTCLTVRAVHLEVIEDMTSSAFVNALRRFVSIRGKVKQYRSDRGTNFVGATDSVQVEAVNVEDNISQKFLKDSESVWLFNAPHSSHMGGSWERMIGVVRRVLDSVLLNVKTLTHDVLTTLMAEVAAMVNARPIVPVSSDPDEPEVLTPSTLLTHKVQCDQPPVGDMDIKSLYLAQWKRVQNLADQFWFKWKRDYLQSLQNRRKWNFEQESIAVDDVVLLKDREVDRNCWPMGRVTRVFPSEDGKIRKVEICVVRDSKKNLYIRPIVEFVVLVKSCSHVKEAALLKSAKS